MNNAEIKLQRIRELVEEAKKRAKPTDAPALDLLTYEEFDEIAKLAGVNLKCLEYYTHSIFSSPRS